MISISWDLHILSLGMGTLHFMCLSLLCIICLLCMVAMELYLNIDEAVILVILMGNQDYKCCVLIISDIQEVRRIFFQTCLAYLILDLSVILIVVRKMGGGLSQK